jgi:hypothetical protein
MKLCAVMAQLGSSVLINWIEWIGQENRKIENRKNSLEPSSRSIKAEEGCVQISYRNLTHYATKRNRHREMYTPIPTKASSLS